jgi:hypothetical protein
MSSHWYHWWYCQFFCIMSSHWYHWWYCQCIYYFDICFVYLLILFFDSIISLVLLMLYAWVMGYAVDLSLLLFRVL